MCDKKHEWLCDECFYKITHESEFTFCAECSEKLKHTCFDCKILQREPIEGLCKPCVSEFHLKEVLP